MELKTRKRWAIVILLVGLPVYLGVAWFLSNWIYDIWGRLPVLVEFALYVALGIIWVLPFRRVFRGVGREE